MGLVVGKIGKQNRFLHRQRSLQHGIPPTKHGYGSESKHESTQNHMFFASVMS